MKKYIVVIKMYMDYILNSMILPFMKRKKYNILSDDETIRMIVEDGYSVSRFGDGEFKWLLGKKLNSFQNNNEALSEKLKNILPLKNDENMKILIGIPKALNDLSEYTLDAKICWKSVIVTEFRKIEPYLNREIYCNTNITRPYMDYKNKDKNIMKEKFEKIKKIWNKRNIVIIEGEKTKLGVGNDLFDNCNSIQRIICPAKNAFDKYNEIYLEILKCSKDKLFLISLGPTATVLAYELSKNGYQCIDTGHIDIEYMWFRNNCIKKEAIKGKYVNEVPNNDLSYIKDEKYENEIIAHIM